MLELATVVAAIGLWGGEWEGRHVRLRVDNTAALCCLIACRGRRLLMSILIGEVGALRAKLRFRYSCRHVSTQDNVVADGLSRGMTRIQGVKLGMRRQVGCGGWHGLQTALRACHTPGTATARRRRRGDGTSGSRGRYGGPT